MSAEQPNEDFLFNTARQMKSAGERDAFLAEACGDNAELRERIEKLLAAYSEESQFLEQPPAEFGATVLTGPQAEDRAAALEAGLAATFSDDEAVVVGNAGHSVLKTLDQTITMPRVALRESQAEGDDPITRPNSLEMPERDSDSRYQLQGEIARGGMGAIIKGRDVDLGRDLAIKVLLDSHKDRPEVIQRFVEEAQIGGQLQHPGIAPVYELGTFKDKRPFFSMKLVKGETLSKLLADREEAAAERGRFIGIFEQVCQTMAYAHSRGVIHRDLKPANIMVGAFGEVQVMDWGLAKVLSTGGVADEKKSQMLQSGQSVIATLRSGVGSDSPGVMGSVGSHTQMGSVMGTPAYMPPEQALGEIDQMDERADVFGLGAILCEILTGKPPYVGTDGTAVFRQASRGKLDDCMARLDACGADEDLVALAKHCLELEPKERPRDAGALAERVTRYLESVETKLRRTEVERATEAARAIEARKRMRVTLALAATVLLSLGVGGAGWRWMELQAIERREVATTSINSALGDAQLHQSLAESAELETQVAELEKAVSRAKQAVEIASTEDVEASLSSKAMTLLADLQSRANSVQKLAEQARKDQEFKTELELIRLSQSDGTTVTVTLAAQIASRKATIVVADTQAGFESTKGDQRDADYDPETSGETPDAGPDGSRDDESQAVPGPESAVVQLFDISTTLQRYDDVFRHAGFDLRALSVSEAAGLIRSSAIQETLIDAIDNWARAFDESKSPVVGNPASDEVADLSRTKLLAIANAADGSEWRRAVRAALERNDTAQLKVLAGTDEARSQSPELIAWLGAALRNGDEIDRSVAVLLEAQRNHPGDFWLNYELGKSFSRQGNHLEGLGFARASLGIRPESPAAMIALAVVSSEAGRHADAIIFHRAVIAKNPRLYDAHVGLGLAATQMADWDTAIAAYRTAIELKPDNGELYGALALALRSTRRYEEAVDEARKGVELDPANAQAHIYLGQVLNRLRLGGVLQNEAALAAYRKAIKLEPTNARVYYYPGCGVDELRTAIQLDPQFAEAHATLGNVLFAQKKFDESLAACEKAIEVAPNSSLGYRTSIQPLLELGHGDQAVANGRRAIVLNPQDGQAHAWLGEALRSQGNLKEAIELQRRAVELEPNDWGLVAKLAESLKSQGSSDLSAIYMQILEWVPESTAALRALTDSVPNVPADLSQFRDLVDRNLKNSQFLNSTAWWLVTHRDEQGQFQHLDDAVRWAKTASELEPDSGMILNTLGVAYYRQGEWRAAIDVLQKCESLNRGEPSDALFLAMAYQKLGDRSQSLEHYLQALTLRGASNFDSETESFYIEARLLLDLQREDLETLLARTPENAGLARELAELLLAPVDQGWTILTPIEMKSAGGATLTLLDDGSILASGTNAPRDQYHLEFVVPDDIDLRSVSLEALTDPSLPANGPGRDTKGSFVLNQWQLTATPQEGREARTLKFDAAVADYEYRHYPIRPNGWWSIDGGPSTSRVAIWQSADSQLLTRGRTLNLLLDFDRKERATNLGRFRLSISDDPSAFVWEKTRFGAMKLTDPWAKLAAARHIVGDQQGFDKLLERLPATASLELAGFLTERGKSLLAAKFNNEALSQLLEARELVARVAAKHPESKWTVLQPKKMISTGGATLTKLDDHSILASGKNPDKEVYEFEAQLEAGSLTAIRLEGLTHESLPHGHSRFENGNVVLSEFEAAVTAGGEATEWHSIRFGAAWADYAQDGYGVERAVDGNQDTFWNTAGYERIGNRTAIFTAETPFGYKSGTRLRIRLRHESQWDQHAFGRMRLSVTRDPQAIENAPFDEQLKESDLAGLEIALGNAYSQLGQVDEAVTAFHQALDLTDDRDIQTKILQAASDYDGVLDKLTKLRPKDAALQDTLARHSQARGDLVTARAAAATARTLYEQQLAAEPAKSVVARSLADLLLLDAEMATTWTILEPTELKSEGGATLILLEDGSILARGQNPDKDVYEVNVDAGVEEIAAIRLEVIPDESLPLGGFSRSDHGNAVLSSFEAESYAVDDPSKTQVAAISEGFTTSDHNNDFEGCLNTTDKGWTLRKDENTGVTIAYFKLEEPLRSEDSTAVRIRMRHRSQWKQHQFGRFRLSVTDDPFAYEYASVRIAALKLTDPWARLTAAYAFVGDQQALARLQDQHPEAASLELAQILAERGKLSLTAQHVNEALPQLVKARDLFVSLAAKQRPSNWTVLEPSKMTSAGGATLTRLDDHSILASGNNPDNEVYEFETELKGGDFTAIRLEGLTHPSLADGSHGRSSNVVLTEFEAEAASAEATETWQPISFNKVWANHPEAGTNIENAIDGDLQEGWTTYQKDVRLDRTAIFAAASPFGHKAGTRLRIRLRHESKYPRHTFGRMRLSVTRDPHAIEDAPIQQQLAESDLAGLEIALGNAYSRLGQVDEAATAFTQVLDQTADQGIRTKIIETASAHVGVLDKLAKLRPQDAVLHDALARHSQASGDIAAARAAAATARMLYEQQLVAEPANSAVAQSLADLLLLDAEMATTWTTLEPTEMKSKGGATLTLLEDRSILASGTNAPRDQYQLQFVVPADIELLSVRLEAMTDPSLPADGPGRDTKGSFVLNPWQLTATPEEGGEARALSFVAAVADYEYRDYPIRPNGWWSIDGGPSTSRVAIWQTEQTQLLTRGTTLNLLLDFERGERVTNLGRFRLSISDSSRAFDILTSQKIADPWAKLAAAYHVIGDQPQLDKLLGQHPEAKSAIDTLNGWKWLRDLRASGVAFKSGKQLPDGTWELDLEGATITDLAILKGPPISRLILKNTGVSDLSPLSDMPLKHLDLEGTKVSDLSPLHGMPLQNLQVHGTKVTDLAPVRGMPLTNLRLHKCEELTDLSPIAECKELKELTLPTNAQDIEFLRTLPKLERIGFSVDPNNGYRPDKTAEEFWQEFDANKD